MLNLELLTVKVSRASAEMALEFFNSNPSETILTTGAKAYLELLGAFGASVYTRRSLEAIANRDGSSLEALVEIHESVLLERLNNLQTWIGGA